MKFRTDGSYSPFSDNVTHAIILFKKAPQTQIYYFISTTLKCAIMHTLFSKKDTSLNSFK